MKLFCRLLFAAFCSLFLFSCSPEISIRAKNADDAEISVSALFSKKLTGTFAELTGASDSAVISSSDIKNFLERAGATNVTARTKDNHFASADGTFSSLSKSTLSSSGLLIRTPSSVKLTLGPVQLLSLYEQLDEDSRGYLDLLMIPCLNDETMTVNEYQELLSSVYGTDIASEIINARVKITLKSPDSKKAENSSILLGELLTLTKSRSWSVSF